MSDSESNEQAELDEQAIPVLEALEKLNLDELSMAGLLVKNVVKNLRRYRSLPVDLRFTLLIDKFYWLLDALKIFVAEEFNESEAGLYFALIDFFQKEVEDLDQYVQQSQEQRAQKNERRQVLERIEQKLDAVLLGPDYPAGQALMAEAEEDFFHQQLSHQEK